MFFAGHVMFFAGSLSFLLVAFSFFAGSGLKRATPGVRTSAHQMPKNSSIIIYRSTKVPCRTFCHIKPWRDICLCGLLLHDNLHITLQRNRRGPHEHDNTNQAKFGEDIPRRGDVFRMGASVIQSVEGVISKCCDADKQCPGQAKDHQCCANSEFVTRLARWNMETHFKVLWACSLRSNIIHIFKADM
jgi:hypothetical protein